jgi:hypothetical protein
MSDLTLLFITAGKRPEKWTKFHKEQLDKLPYPMITLHDEEKQGYQRIYEQLLIGCKQATTPYIGVVEDDVLYPPEHFSEFRPKMDEFAYNQHRWALFMWWKPTYNWRNRVSNCSLIAPRELAIEALEERFAKHPVWPYVGELGRWRIDQVLQVKKRKMVEWYSTIGIIQINHDDATEERQKAHWKDLGPVKAYDIPRWGKASELIKEYA